MPAIVGFVKINAISLSGMFQVGDVFWTSPESEASVFAGAGSYNVGDGLRTKTKTHINFVAD
ncbi:spore germination protein [Pueribacillus sp. YX66]|uniref:spore germination protein n=1 Tax=Pueribacillus sp. YX66 TaxID=3229242 RepID=UPI00358D98A3